MNDEVAGLRARLASNVQGDVYSALIRIGKLEVRELESDVAKFLAHEDPELRSAAIRVLGFYWELPAYAAVASEMIDAESDPAPRAVAIMAIGSYFRGSRSPEVVRRLAMVLVDEENNRRVRSAAYDSIATIVGLGAVARAMSLLVGVSRPSGPEGEGQAGVAGSFRT
jgi:HEAT repeat protein